MDRVKVQVEVIDFNRKSTVGNSSPKHSKTVQQISKNQFTSFSLETQQKQKSQINTDFAHYFPKRHKSLAIILSFFDRAHHVAGYKYLAMTYKMIASGCWLSLPTVNRWMRFAIKSNWIIAQEPRPGYANRYKLNVEKIRDLIGNITGQAPKSVLNGAINSTAQLNPHIEIQDNQEHEVIKNQKLINGIDTEKPKPKLKNKKRIKIITVKTNVQITNINSEANIPGALSEATQYGAGTNSTCTPVDNNHVLNKNIPETPTPTDKDKPLISPSVTEDENSIISNDGTSETPPGVSKGTNLTNTSPTLPPQNEVADVSRELDREPLLERAESCGVQLNAYIVDLCIKASLSRLNDAIEALEQQAANKRVNRQNGQAMGEDVDNKSNPNYNFYHLPDPNRFLIKAIHQGWKANSKSDHYSNSSALFEYKPSITIEQIKRMYPEPQWIDVAVHFGYHPDDLDDDWW